MEKIKYTRHKDYEFIKEIFLEKVKTMNGELPEGFDNEIFISAFMKIYFHLTEKYKDVKLQPKDIPDVERFEEREQYTVSQFLFNRIAKNIKTIEISNDASETSSGGFYNAEQKKLKIFKATIENSAGYQFEKYKTLNFETEEDFNKILTEYLIIHELVHAISFDDNSVGFRSSDKEISINEGFTDSLALEISGFGKFFEYLPKHIEGDRFGIIPRNSVSTYVVETNIADLMRVVVNTDLILPYLVNPYQTKWKEFGKLDKSCYPVKGDKEVYDYIAEELNVITTKAKSVSENERLERLQNLQGCLIEDVLKNKYNEKFAERLKLRNTTYEEVVKYEQDMNTIISKLVITIPKDVAIQVYTQGIYGLQYGDLNKVKELVKTGKIENTKNIQQYIKLMEIRESIFEYKNQQSQEDNVTI